MSRYYARKDWHQHLQALKDIRWEISEGGRRLLGGTADEFAKLGGRIETAVGSSGARVERAVRSEGSATRGELAGIRAGIADAEAARRADAAELLQQQQISQEIQALGFATIHFDLTKVRQDLSGMNARFEWGFQELADGLGRTGDTLNELLAVARTPAQTWAYEQFEIARDAHRKHLYDDAIEYATRAIDGHQGHTGYRLDHRPHLLLGLIRLGDRESVKLREPEPHLAEKHFLDAAKYAEADFKEAAAEAYCCASHAASTQHAFERALGHARRGLSLYHSVPELSFQAGKVCMCLDRIKDARAHLQNAIALDGRYFGKVLADEDYVLHDPGLYQFLAQIRDQRADGLRRLVAELIALLNSNVRDTRSAISVLPRALQKTKFGRPNIADRLESTGKSVEGMAQIRASEGWLPILESEDALRRVAMQISSINNDGIAQISGLRTEPLEQAPVASSYESQPISDTYVDWDIVRILSWALAIGWGLLMLALFWSDPRDGVFGKAVIVIFVPLLFYWPIKALVGVAMKIFLVWRASSRKSGFERRVAARDAQMMEFNKRQGDTKTQLSALEQLLLSNSRSFSDRFAQAFPSSSSAS